MAIDTWRAETRRRNREEQVVAMELQTNDPNTSTVREEISPKLDEALNQLKHEDRQALLLRFYARKTMRDVGAALGVSEDAAKMRVSRAVERLRTQLGLAGASCTATILVATLTANVVEAALAKLISKLTAMQIPVVVGIAGTGGWLALLLRPSSMKIAAVGGVLALISWYGLRHLGTSETRVTTDVVETPAGSEVEPAQDLSRHRPEWTGPRHAAAMPLSKVIKIRIHVLGSETGVGLANSRIHYVFFGPGGEGEGHDILTDNYGDVSVQEPDDPTKNSGPNVFVAAEGHVPKVLAFQGREAPADYTVQLDPAMTANGIVVDEQGSAVPGVQIFVQGPGNKSETMENVDFQTCPVISSKEGAWVCSYIPKDYTNVIRFILKKADYAVTFPVVPVASVGLTDLVLTINRGYVILGQITDAQRKPIGNAKINVVSGMRDKRQFTSTDEQGWFILTGVAGDTEPDVFYTQPPLQTNAAGAVVIRGLTGNGLLHADLTAQAQGYASQTAKVDLFGTTNVVNLTLAVGNILRGQVVDTTGNPIPNAVVRTDFDFRKQIDPGFNWTAHTDANGRFEWDSAPLEEICYWFEADGYNTIRGLPLPANGDDHKITLPRHGRRDGR